MQGYSKWVWSYDKGDKYLSYSVSGGQSLNSPPSSSIAAKGEGRAKILGASAVTFPATLSRVSLQPWLPLAQGTRGQATVPRLSIPLHLTPPPLQGSLNQEAGWGHSCLPSSSIKQSQEAHSCPNCDFALGRQYKSYSGIKAHAHSHQAKQFDKTG